MEDKQIIELYWERSEDAIKETESKYGWLCIDIANHILENTEEAELCVKESMELLWETIPPHRPQNLKAYLCKVTRIHALQMKYPEFLEHEVNLFDAELVIYDFLKGLEPEQRKLFVSRYWYLSSVSEIAMQYKMCEGKVEKTVQSLRQKLDGMLEEKHIHLHNGEDLLFAMTEIEDRYLVEAEPVQVEPSVASNEVQDSKSVIQQVWKKYQISIMACVLFLIFVLFVWPKNPIQEPDKITIDTGLEGLVQILDGDTMSVEDFDKLAEKLPWSEGRANAALPIYKNLSYTGALGAAVYLDEGILWTMAEEIATKLEMEIIGSRYTSVTDEDNVVATGIVATTDLGTIEVNGRGEVYVSFTDGVTLPPGYELSSEASKTNADKNVDFLISYYWDVLGSDDLTPDSYAIYDLEGNRQMNHRAVGTRNGYSDVESYYFNQVYFYHDEQGKLTGFRFGDCRIATENLGFYPLITLEEAKVLLQEGKYDTHVWAPFVYDEANIRRIELMYQKNKSDEYYQPYYCFYILLEDGVTYGKFYVPAAQGVELFEAPPEPAIKILDLRDYEKMAGDFEYYSDGKYYTVEDGEITEKDRNDGSMDITFYGSQYGIMGNAGENVKIVDALNGTIIDTGIPCDDLYFVSNAGDDYFAFVFDGKGIAILEKSSGQIIKLTTDKIICAVNNIAYKDDLLYIETWYNGPLVFVISDFEEIQEAEDLLLE